MKVVVRKVLNRFGLLDRVRRVKKKFSSIENEFKPGDPRTLISTIQCMNWLIEKQGRELGDFMEFGIYRGFNVWFAQAYARTQQVTGIRYFGFDSFIGIPPVDGIDKGGAFHEGDFSAYRDEVETWLTRFGVDWDRTKLISGFFDKSLHSGLYSEYKLEKCSLCVVDCDLYSSTVPVLEFVRPLLKSGSVIYFDDWADFGEAADKGEPLAFREFQERVAGELTFEPFTDLKKVGGKGKAFIVA